MIGRLLLISLLMSCAWTPSTFPATVNMDGSLSSEQKILLIESVRRWNKAAGFEVLRAVKDNKRLIQPGRIQVTDRKLKEGYTGNTRFGAFGCRISLGEKTEQIDTVIHELGHCLGLDDETDNPISVMHERGLSRGGQLILQKHVDHVRTAAGMIDMFCGSEDVRECPTQPMQQSQLAPAPAL